MYNSSTPYQKPLKPTRGTDGGVKTASQWVAWQTGLSPSRARSIVRIAERRYELPATYNAFANGEVAVVAKFVPSAYDLQRADLARHTTVTQLTKAVSRYTFEPAPEPAPAAQTNPTDFVHHHRRTWPMPPLRRVQRHPTGDHWQRASRNARPFVPQRLRRGHLDRRPHTRLRTIIGH